MTCFRWMNGVETKFDQDPVLGNSRRNNNATTCVLEHLKHSLNIFDHQRGAGRILILDTSVAFMHAGADEDIYVKNTP